MSLHFNAPGRTSFGGRYTHADLRVAEQVAKTLREAGHRIWFAEWALRSGDSIVDRIGQAINTSDFLIVLLSRRSVESAWVQKELDSALTQELRDRAVSVVPVLLEDCEVPSRLADRQVFDLRHDFQEGLGQLARQLPVIPDIDFSRPGPIKFEGIVTDLLLELGFSTQSTRLTSDHQFDFLFKYRSRDPLGVERLESWLVEVKLYENERVGFSALHSLHTSLLASSIGERGLVVTNGRLTSVAREFLEDAQKNSPRRLRVIDGAELTNLVMRYPHLVERYFPPRDQ